MGCKSSSALPFFQVLLHSFTVSSSVNFNQRKRKPSVHFRPLPCNHHQRSTPLLSTTTNNRLQQKKSTMASYFSFSASTIGEDLFYNYRRVVDNEKDIEVRPVRGKGKGLFSLHYIAPKAFITEYWGDKITEKEKNRRQVEREQAGLRNGYTARLRDGWYIDAMHCQSLARYANHSCSPNAKLYTVDIGGSNGCLLYTSDAADD